MSKCKCKECVHNEVCEESTPYGEHDCEDFKSKSLLVELPCKVGDKVYILGCKTDKDELEIFEDVVVEVIIRHFDEYQIRRIRVKDFGNSGYINFCYLGKTVFLDRAEAEKKLKEMG